MARVKLDIPEKISFTMTLPVRISDINYGNHLGNEAMVNIIHEARLQWLKSGGYTELEIEGYSLIMSDLIVEYKKQGYYGDVLSVSVRIGEIGRSGFDMYYAVHNQQEVLIAKAKTGMACFDYTNQKPVHLPKNFSSFLMR